VHALPVAYAAVAAPEEIAVALEVEGEAGGTWSVVRQAGDWKLYHGQAHEPAASITIGAEQFWRLLTRGISAESARAQARVEGDRRLIEPFFAAVAIIA
jgi:hypothetical protein